MCCERVRQGDLHGTRKERFPGSSHVLRGGKRVVSSRARESAAFQRNACNLTSVPVCHAFRFSLVISELSPRVDSPVFFCDSPSLQVMAAPETIQVSSLPLPPVQYINLYTDDNVRRGRAPRPPPPIHDSYSMFGNVFNADDTIIRPLEAQGIKRLYPQHFDRRRELKKLNHSLLVNFLDLIDLLVRCPDSPRRAEKVEDLSLLFIHIHHLLNEFRPHQARETLRVMMELQRRQRHETAQRFQKHLEKVQEILQHALQMLPDTSELDSKLAINTDAMESVDNLGFEQQNQDPCSPSDRIMCKVIDDMLSSNGLF